MVDNSNVSMVKCSRCGNLVEKALTKNGVCLKCLQVEGYTYEKILIDCEAGVYDEDEYENEVEMNDEDVDRVLSSLCEEKTDAEILESLKSVENRKIWMIVKFYAANIYDNDTISKYMGALNTIIDRSAKKLIRVKCYLTLDKDVAQRNSSDIIDSEGGVYLIRRK